MSKEQPSVEESNDKELENIDLNLQEIELLYRSRCVKASGNNVKVREIERPEQ